MDAYFQKLNQSLRNYPRAIPCLLIDLDILDENLVTLKKNWNPQAAFRIVVKSLPSVALIEYIMKKGYTHKLMVFHQPFLTDLASRLDTQSSILLGKPMPVKTAGYFFKNLPENERGFDPYKQIQWLVDTKERIIQYLELSKAIGKSLRLNLEIDVGLHRGGFTTSGELAGALQLISDNPNHLTLAGLMGYDPHVVKLPKVIRTPEKAFRLANDFYQECKNLIKNNFPGLWSDDLTFNGAGSPSIELHQKLDSPLNDVSLGSCLVKPTTFDLPTLAAFQPACFIAAPVLKAFNNTTLPAMEGMAKWLGMLRPGYQKSYFIYGGLWKADYHYPKGIKQNPLFGSTNQNMLNAPNKTKLAVDDFVFLRPHQSEFVFLQFGNVLAIRDGQIVAEWQILKNH
ncbi:MAG: alanine racemase [Bacteroidota bacterium]